MILNIKNYIFLLIIFIGFYIIFSEYKIILSFNIDTDENKTLKNETININKTEIVKPKNNIKIVNRNNDEELFKIKHILLEGDTMLSILKKYQLKNKIIYEVIDEINKYYNLRKLKVNDAIILYSNQKNEIKKIELNLEIDKILVLKISDKITSKIRELEKKSYQLSKEFKINESLYSDGLENNIPQNILIKLIKLFSFDLDFQRDIKKNTIVSLSYGYNEIKEGNRIEYKDINYALISIDGKKLEYFKFMTDDGFIDYFNREGKNVKKSILKTPLDGARLSSSFGMRKHPISGYNKMHKGVDFAAPKGTPVYAGGNGVIEYVGKNGGYGNYIRIRHNNEYKTAYAHLSGFKKGISSGVRVNQGEVIGYVGNTGNSTGPHLHYEIIFQNKQINPLKLKLPSGKVLKGDELKRFKSEFLRIYADHLNMLYE